MKIHKTIFLLIGVMLLIIPLLLLGKEENKSFAQQGIVDLNESNFNEEKIIPLDGEWEFYAGQLYNPSDFTKGSITNAAMLNVPGIWTKGEEQGIGTYRLQIRNVPTNQILGIKKQNIRSASKIYINGELISEEGFASKDKESYKEGNNPQLLFFQTDSGTLDLVIQVSDFSFNSAGIANSIYFGEQEQLVKNYYQKVLAEVSVITILMTIGFLYILLYLFVERYRRREFFILSFALSCIFFAIINLCLSERTIIFILPDLSFEGMFKIKDTSIFLATISFIFIVSQFEKRLFALWFRNLLIAIYLIYTIIIVLTPLNFYHNFLPLFVTLNAFTYLFGMIKSLYYYFKEQHFRNSGNHTVILFSMVNINVYNIDLLLYSFGYTQDLTLGFYNVLLYAIALAIFLTIQVNQSYKKNDYLSNELDVTEQAYLLAQIKPHFFFNTLTSIMSLCYTDGKKAAQLLSHFSSFLRHSFEFNSKDVFITVERELKLLKSYIAIEKERFGEKLQVVFEVDENVLNESIIPLSIQPLVENAILHGINCKEDGGIITVIINKTETYLSIAVVDNGIGLTSEKIKELSSINPDKTTRHGIGISNINKRLAKFYQTQLTIESELGLWTKIQFNVPIN
ncbi:signal transduction histidine kinase LytS [Ureibacillus xyleni]|uniref:Signal transduction histidine kinase LytS n=1 Tax=Ureibacillus xyleni TaxID=614648 RepID=A0A285RJV2_9BACL|nr:histidine kinase [Ureibacillus xyleni]SOB94144.1 signal transduction histidine kinase LytS [Ureibacillus xyleni]